MYSGTIDNQIIKARFGGDIGCYIRPEWAPQCKKVSVV